MSRRIPERILTPIGVALLGIVLVILAALQYRWIGEISEADRDRLEKALVSSAHQFRADFNRELVRLVASLEIDPRTIEGRDWSQLAERLNIWAETSPDGVAVAQVYLLEVDQQGQDRRLLALNRGAGTFDESDWPERLRGLADRPSQPGGRRGLFSAAPGWSLAGAAPVLTLPLLSFEPPERAPGLAEDERRGRRPLFLGVLYVELDQDFLSGAVFPSLTARYFNTSSDLLYDVAVLSGGTDPSLVYCSNPAARIDSFDGDAARFPLLWSREEGGGDRGLRFGGPGFGGFSGLRRVPGEEPPDGRPPPRGRGGPGASVRPAGSGAPWVLAVRHRGGSIDSVVEGLRKRNIAISLGVLALLGAAMGVVLVSTRRAQRLADLQMAFVAGVSHELRTPLAVIRSAGDNLAAGVISEPDQVREYGVLVRDEGRRLTSMVEQTLRFAALQAGKLQYRLEPASLKDIIAEAVDAVRGVAADQQIELQLDLAQDLPPVRVDPGAARQLIENLLRNAIKYRGESAFVALRARADSGSVYLEVEDHGVGVDPQDLPYIFDPFYRGRPAIDGQIQGSGLGLSLARDAADAFNGSLSVESRPGEKTIFTLKLPVCGDKASV